MAKTVADVARMLQAIAGPNRRDATAAATAFPDYVKPPTGDIRGLRIGVPTEYFFDGIHAETEAAVRRAVSLLE